MLTSRAGPDGSDSPDAMGAGALDRESSNLVAQHEDDGDEDGCRQSIPCE